MYVPLIVFDFDFDFNAFHFIFILLMLLYYTNLYVYLGPKRKIPEFPV